MGIPAEKSSARGRDGGFNARFAGAEYGPWFW